MQSQLKKTTYSCWIFLYMRSEWSKPNINTFWFGDHVSVSIDLNVFVEYIYNAKYQYASVHWLRQEHF